MKNDTFRACRLFLGMTQEEFADFLGVSRSQVGRIETGSVSVSPKVKTKLVFKFDMNEAFFAFYEKMTRES